MGSQHQEFGWQLLRMFAVTLLKADATLSVEEHLQLIGLNGDPLRAAPIQTDRDMPVGHIFIRFDMGDWGAFLQ